MKDKAGYILIKRPEHPYANNNGYVREHRLVIEQHLHRFLLPSEIVHHLNHIKDDNRIENLQLVSSQSAHIKYEFASGGMEGSRKSQFKKGDKTNLGRKHTEEWIEKTVKTLTPFKKGHLYYPRKKKGDL